MATRGNSLFANSMHFFVHNSFLFTVIDMFMVHALLLFIFIFANIVPLIYFNTISLVVYLFCIILCYLGHPIPVYLSIFIEVTIYVIFATYYVGWHSASCCFLCAIVPVIIHFGFSLLGTKHRFLMALLLAGNFVIYLILYLNFCRTEPLFKINDTTQNCLVILASFTMVFSMIFYSVIYMYSAEYKAASLEKENEKLSTDAITDTLTGLINRRGFLANISEFMKEDLCHYCIAFCDIDNFKRVNDTYGHDGGDEVLKHVAKTLKKEMQGCDVCRWGGEEMVIFMKYYDFEVAKQKMEYIRNYIETGSTVFYNKRINVTLTIGVEEYIETYKTPEEIIKVADDRMYFGKQHGKNMVVSEIKDEWIGVKE